jgi:hypothetical protein
MTRFTVAAFNYEGGGYAPGRGFDMRPLQLQFAELHEAPALVLLCITDQAAPIWLVPRDFTKIACARRGHGKGAPQPTRPHDGGEFGRSWIRRRAA